jgi:hypothetical protein
MIKSKIVFIIVILLSIIVFPYSFLILVLKSDFFSSIVPGWHTTIYPISALIKFIVLLIVAFFYWKLSKVVNEINIRKAVFYFLLTFPSVLITKLDLYELLNYSLKDAENFMLKIQIIVFIRILTNLLFFAGQILFWIYYKKSMRKINLNFLNSTEV